MTEEVSQYFANEIVCGAKLVIDIRTQSRIGGERMDLRKGIAYWEENAVDLRVFVLKGGR